MRYEDLKTSAILSEFETRIVLGYMSGKVAKEIGVDLGTSVATIARYTRYIYDKTGIKHSLSAMAKWFICENCNINPELFEI